jgi:hypothetical protein
MKNILKNSKEKWTGKRTSPDDDDSTTFSTQSIRQLIAESEDLRTQRRQGHDAVEQQQQLQLHWCGQPRKSLNYWETVQ